MGLDLLACSFSSDAQFDVNHVRYLNSNLDGFA